MSVVVLPKHVAAVLKCQKNPLRALQIFNSVKKEDGFTHNLFTYKCMVEKLGYYGEFKAMEGVIQEARQKIDNRLLEGVYITAIRAYGKKRKVQEAVDVFDKMDFFNCEPSVHSYNTIMNILVEHAYFKQAHKVYMKMLEKGISPDVYTFTIRIKSFCRTKRPNVALRLLNNMLHQGCEFNAVTCCTVIGGFYQVNCRVEACELFDEMIRLGITPDVTTFNKLILCTLCKKGDVQESERLLNKILKRGVFPNLFTCNLFIQGLSEKGQLNEAARMLEALRKEGLSADVVTYNTLICGLCKHSKVAEAESYLHKMVNRGFEPDAFTYNTIIGAYCKLGMIQKADIILNNAVFKGFVPDEFTFCALICGLCQDGDFNRAKSLFNEATGKGMKSNVILYNTLIKGMCQQGLILEALKLMTEMPEKGCRPNTWTYNLIINGLCKMGCVSDASNNLNDAMAKGILPDIFTFNTLIDGYCKQSKLADAIEILNTMWDHDVVPDVITYNTMLDGLCKLKTSDDVMETFKVMVEKGCVPNIITYNILIDSLCKSRNFMKALDLLEDIQSKCLIPDTVTFGTLINGFCENEDLDGAYELFRRMKRQYKCSHTTATYNILISAFAKKLKMDMAEKLFLEMNEYGCPPDNYTYRCMIDGFCKVDNTEFGYKFLLDNMTKEFLPSKETVGRVINCLCVKNRLLEGVGIIHLMVQKGVVPDVVHTIFVADKKDVAAPKIVVEDLLKKNHITYYAYELLYDGIRDKKILKKLSMKINEEASDKVLEVEQKYNVIRKPVYYKRNNITKAIPDFWLTAFLSHPVLGELLTEEDQKNFNANPYFENTNLSKTYTFLEDGLTKISATTIKWKEGMGIPNGVAHEKNGNKQPHAEESFFTWFSEVNQKDEEEDETLEIQDEVAEIIKDDLWLNPLTYFNNEPDEEDFDGDEGKDSEGSEDDEEQDEDEDGDE